MRRLIALAAVAALTGCGSSAQQSSNPLRIDTNPFRIAVGPAGEDTHARLRYQVSSTGEQFALTKVISSHGDTYDVATNEPGRTATVTVADHGSSYRVSVRLHPEKGVQQVYDAFDTHAGDHFLGGGERSGPVDLRGQVLAVKVSESCTYAPVPFFMSSAGWGLRLATANVSALAFPGSPGGSGCKSGDEPRCEFPPLPERVEVCVQGARLDEDVYLGDFPHVLAAYEHEVGMPPAPRAGEFQLIKWRGRSVFTGPQNLFEDIQRFRAAHIPIGWVLLDDVWQGCMGTLAFDSSRFPDPTALISRVHALGVKFMLWVSPKVVCHDGYSVEPRLGPPDEATLDLRNPSVVAEFRRRLRKLAALGVDGVKGDRGDETDVERYGEALPNEYPLLYAKDVVSIFPVSLFRAAYAGSPAPSMWAGDQNGDYGGLQAAIHSGLSAGTSGFPMWGSDIGGYNSANLTGDVFARWAQLGAVSPVMEVGGGGPNATPWTLGTDAMNALRRAATVHYALIPYFRSLIETHQPVLEPLAFGYPDDAESWKADLELLVGPDLLAAPVTGGGTTPSVYLPKGSWVDLFTGATIAGGSSFTRTTPMDAFPLYVRDGAVIPFGSGVLATNHATISLNGKPVFVPAAERPARVTVGGRAVAWTWNPGPLPGVVIGSNGTAARGEVVLSAT